MHYISIYYYICIINQLIDLGGSPKNANLKQNKNMKKVINFAILNSENLLQDSFHATSAKQALRKAKTSFKKTCDAWHVLESWRAIPYAEFEKMWEQGKAFH